VQFLLNSEFASFSIETRLLSSARTFAYVQTFVDGKTHREYGKHLFSDCDKTVTGDESIHVYYLGT
jgi:hypothetical protein